MQIIPAFVTQNKCYQAGAPLYPQGIMLHSVGMRAAVCCGICAQL